MNRPSSKQDFDDTDRTKSTYLEAQIRKVASSLSEAERAVLFTQGMQIIYGGAPKKAVRSER
jgi:hypothetical protein